jgi:hypothetical protein
MFAEPKQNLALQSYKPSKPRQNISQNENPTTTAKRQEKKN